MEHVPNIFGGGTILRGEKPGYVRTLEVSEFDSKPWLAANFTSGRSLPPVIFILFTEPGQFRDLLEGAV